MKVWGQVLVVGVIAVGGVFAYIYRDSLPFIGTKTDVVKSVARNVPALPIEAVPVKRMEITRTIEAVGTAQANEAVTITAKATGIVERLNFLEGQVVKTGVILVELEAAESTANIGALRAARDAARMSYDRAKQLIESKAVAQARLDELSKAYEGAEARLRAEQAKFSDSVIRAPFTGKLGLRKVSLGALVRPGDVITTLDDTTVIKLEFEIPETVLGGVTIGNMVNARATSMPDRKFNGVVTTIDSRIDPTSRAVRVRAQIPNGDDALKPGMFMTVSLSVGKVPDALMVPEEALLAQGGEQFVFVIRDEKATRTRVTIGQRLPGLAQVVNGLRADDQVAVTGLQQLRDGSRVRQTNAQSGSPPVSGAPLQKSAS
ncbi:MAG: efflux RND transporter periplasmic adaptor subunit [Ferrovibrio sp.]|uniref:efflux RND transporter periplasmic adaptor subunit n=1 Tax=Ferrovibrio sp. TaxID=1917215 RepID=UPI0026092920|nr:efflux RND transporter periplasmic adaptor subunit [Ferrovibrio sp.]MCW0232361.1 efflux RND transporter periplasmic adaptor subunit [Ferrovibrio sp.]